jgi:hypothetical protein
MKSIIIKMEPGVSEVIASCTGICQPAEGETLPEGSGFTFHRWIDTELAEYYISASDEAFDAAIDEMIAKGLTITFSPEPEPVEEEVPIA